MTDYPSQPLHVIAMLDEKLCQSARNGSLTCRVPEL